MLSKITIQKLNKKLLNFSANNKSVKLNGTLRTKNNPIKLNGLSGETDVRSLTAHDVNAIYRNIGDRARAASGPLTAATTHKDPDSSYSRMGNKFLKPSSYLSSPYYVKEIKPTCEKPARDHVTPFRWHKLITSYDETYKRLINVVILTK